MALCLFAAGDGRSMLRAVQGASAACDGIGCSGTVTRKKSCRPQCRVEFV